MITSDLSSVSLVLTTLCFESSSLLIQLPSFSRLQNRTDASKMQRVLSLLLLLLLLTDFQWRSIHSCRRSRKRRSEPPNYLWISTTGGLSYARCRESISRSRLTFACVQDFFAKAVGHVKKVLLAYGPNGRSRGEATVTFSKTDSAAKAHKDYNGVNVDNRPMKVLTFSLNFDLTCLTAYRSRSWAAQQWFGPRTKVLRTG